MTIDNSTNNQELIDHQVSFILNTQDLISSGKMNVDGSDLRFGGDCCNLYCYYIESGINTTSTKVWVRIPQIAANSTAGLYMFYGNTSASDESDPNCVFDLFDGFDNVVSFSTTQCGSGSPSVGVSSGQLDLNWSSDLVLTSDATFSQGTIYTAEMDVTAASGSWPGLYWFKNSDTRGYGTLLGGSQVRISKSGASTGYCQGHNWASTQFTAGSAARLWSITWLATGNITGQYPGQPMTSTDTEITRDSDLRVGIGGISGGTGAMSINWLRVRKYSSVEPSVSVGTETILPSIDLGADINDCLEDVDLNAGPNFASYEWNGTPGGQTFNVTTSDLYEVVATDDFSCVFTDEIQVTLNDPVEADFNYSATGLSVTFTNTSLNGGTGSSWAFGDGNSSTDPSPAHTYAVSGIYEVCLEESGAASCIDDYCETITVGVASLEELQANYTLFPNPASQSISINLFSDLNANYKITDLNGKLVLKGSLKPGENKINVETLQVGTYLFSIEGETLTQRFVKH